MASDNDVYLSSLGQARSDIDQQVQNTIAEARRQRDVALRQTGQIPGAVGQATANAALQSNGALDRMGARGAALGLGQLGVRSVQPARGEIDQRMADVNSVYGTAAQSLSQGFQEQALQQESRINLISQQLLADNQMQRAAAVSQMQQAAEQRAHAQAMQQAQFTHNTSLAEQNHQNQMTSAQRAQVEQAVLTGAMSPDGTGLDYRALSGIANHYGLSVDQLMQDYAGRGIPIVNQPPTLQNLGGGVVQSSTGGRFLL